MTEPAAATAREIAEEARDILSMPIGDWFVSRIEKAIEAALASAEQRGRDEARQEALREAAELAREKMEDYHKRLDEPEADDASVNLTHYLCGAFNSASNIAAALAALAGKPAQEKQDGQ